MNGRSKIRNRAVAEIFSRIELIEEWGTGIRRILKRAEEYALPNPDFLKSETHSELIFIKKPIKKPIKKLSGNRRLYNI